MLLRETPAAQGRIKAAKVRPVGTPAISIVLQTLRVSGATYLAVPISRDPRPNSRPVMSGIVDSGPEGGHGNGDANDPERTQGTLTPFSPDSVIAFCTVPSARILVTNSSTARSAATARLRTPIAICTTLKRPGSTWAPGTASAIR